MGSLYGDSRDRIIKLEEKNKALQEEAEILRREVESLRRSQSVVVREMKILHEQSLRLRTENQQLKERIVQIASGKGNDTGINKETFTPRILSEEDIRVENININSWSPRQME